jgi:hypothetical protein
MVKMTKIKKHPSLFPRSVSGIYRKYKWLRDINIKHYKEETNKRKRKEYLRLVAFYDGVVIDLERYLRHKRKGGFHGSVKEN